MADAQADFFSSLEWDGISAVVDTQGNPIQGWKVTSASGFDYSRSYASQIPGQSVPEPAVVSLVLVALSLIGTVRLAGRARGRSASV